ncbi:MAG: hypothetical protein GC156_12675 [Actinomycetales bacterium]|nr:hypothetical protein [Actinomycetales bacterium]
MKPVRRLVLAAAAATMSVLALSACSTPAAGDAATMGSTGVPDDSLRNQVEAVLVAKGQPTTTEDQPLVQQTLSRMVTSYLVDTLAQREGVTVTEGQIDELLANYDGQVGSRAKVEQVFIEQNVAPSQIRTMLRLQMQAQDLGIKLDPHGSANEQGQAVFDAVVKLSEELDTTVSPRYGTWNDQTLSVGPVPTDLSVPPVLN